MTRSAEAYDDFNDDDKDTSRKSRPEATRSQADFKRAQRPQRKGASSVSFNGLHRRRKKRIQW